MLTDVVVAAGDGCLPALLGEVDLVGAELRTAQQVEEHFEYVVEIGLQAGEGDGGGIGVAAGFDFGGADFEKIVQLIAGLGLGASSAPDFAIDVDKSGLVRGFVTEPPRMRAMPSIRGSSWSSCRKITMPLGSSMRLGSCG